MSGIANLFPSFFAGAEQMIFGVADQELQSAEADAKTSGVKKDG